MPRGARGRGRRRRRLGCGGQDGKTKKWVVDTSKGSSNYVPGDYAPAAVSSSSAPASASAAPAAKRNSGVFDPAQCAAPLLPSLALFPSRNSGVLDPAQRGSRLLSSTLAYQASSVLCACGAAKVPCRS